MYRKTSNKREVKHQKSLKVKDKDPLLLKHSITNFSMFTEDKRDLYDKYTIKEETVDASKAQELEEFYGSESTKRANFSEYE